MEERTVVHFQDNPLSLLEAYVDNGEGLDRAGGFAAQVSSLETYPTVSDNCPMEGFRRDVVEENRRRLVQCCGISGGCLLQHVGVVSGGRRRLPINLEWIT